MAYGSCSATVAPLLLVVHVCSGVCIMERSKQQPIKAGNVPRRAAEVGPKLGCKDRGETRYEPRRDGVVTVRASGVDGRDSSKLRTDLLPHTAQGGFPS